MIFWGDLFFLLFLLYCNSIENLIWKSIQFNYFFLFSTLNAESSGLYRELSIHVVDIYTILR